MRITKGVLRTYRTFNYDYKLKLNSTPETFLERKKPWEPGKRFRIVASMGRGSRFLPNLLHRWRKRKWHSRKACDHGPEQVSPQHQTAERLHLLSIF